MVDFRHVREASRPNPNGQMGAMQNYVMHCDVRSWRASAVQGSFFKVELCIVRTKRSTYQKTESPPNPKQLIYQFECRQCGSRYVGKTAQRFAVRISQHVPKHILDAVLDPQRKRPGRPPKKRDNPAEGYQSAVACHLAANADCCRSYRESDFTVLSRCRSKQHRDVLEATYIRCCKPVLCRQKSFVVNLTLFRHTHSMHS